MDLPGGQSLVDLVKLVIVRATPQQRSQADRTKLRDDYKVLALEICLVSMTPSDQQKGRPTRATSTGHARRRNMPATIIARPRDRALAA